MSMSSAAIEAVLIHGPEEYRLAVRWQYLKPHDRAARADADNLARIKLGFPCVWRGHNWKNVPGWAQRVEQWGEEHAK